MMQLLSNFKSQIEKYCKWRESLGFSRDHESHLSKFDVYCYEFHPNEYTITRALAIGWITFEINSNRHCIQNKCASLRSFARFAGNGSYILKEKFITYKRNFNPYILTDEELSKLFISIDRVKKRGDPFFSETAGFIFRLQYTCGLRPQEVRKLRCKDIDFQTGEIFIAKSKLSKDRIVVAAKDVLTLLNAYNIRRNVFCNDNDIFFIHTDGSSISNEQLIDLLQKCWRDANPNIEKSILPHLRPYDLRHRFASAVIQRWIDDGENIYAKLPYLRAYMGHEEFKDTLYYVHILPDNLLSSKGVNWKQIEAVGLEEEIWKH